MSGGTFVPRNECPGGHFFQGDSHSSDTGIVQPYHHQINLTDESGIYGCAMNTNSFPNSTMNVPYFSLLRGVPFRSCEPALYKI